MISQFRLTKKDSNYVRLQPVTQNVNTVVCMANLSQTVEFIANTTDSCSIYTPCPGKKTGQ